jgi:TatA/E family protein of Tat protein translocase
MNFLGMGPMELILIVVLALIVFGPAKLPEIMGQVGKAIRDFQRATSELSEEFNRTITSEVKQAQKTLEEPIKEARGSLEDPLRQTNAALQDATGAVAASTSPASTSPASTSPPSTSPETASPETAAPAAPSRPAEEPRAWPPPPEPLPTSLYDTPSEGLAATVGATAGSSGATSSASPPLADTSQWVWETSSSEASPSKTGTDNTDKNKTNAPRPTDKSVDTRPSSAPARDELVPPY